MDHELRGLIEQYIDFALSDKNMVIMQKYVNGLKPYVKSTEDAMLGLVLGLIIASCTDKVIMYHANDVKKIPADVDATRKVIMDKIPTIRSRVLETFI